MRSDFDFANLLLSPTGVTDLYNAIENGDLGRFEEDFVGRFASMPPDIYGLFEFGLTHLPGPTGRPDESLATYFYLLSEFVSLKDDFRNLALDAMVYCKTDSDTPSHTPEHLRSVLKKLGHPPQ